MKPNEVSDLLSLFRDAKLRYAPRMTDPDEVRAMVRSWSVALDDVHPGYAMQAAQVLLKEAEAFPAPATLRAIALDLQSGAPSPERAWQMAQPGQPRPPGPVLAALRDIGGTHAIKTTDRPYAVREAFMAAYAARKLEAREFAAAINSGRTYDPVTNGVQDAIARNAGASQGNESGGGGRIIPERVSDRLEGRTARQEEGGDDE